jgi:GT2 family glycosyltransferase
VQHPPFVSIIIINYRTYAELGACLNSLAQNPDEHQEVIVIDQESKVDALPEFAQRLPRFVFVPDAANRGFAAGVNRGAALARGKYLLILNPDCSIKPRLSETLACWLDAHPEVGVVAPRIRNEDGTVQPSARRFPDITTVLGGRTSFLTRILPGNWFTKRNLLVGDQPTVPHKVDWVSGACFMVRRDAFEAVGGMDEGFFLYWEDADLCRRLKKAGWDTVYHPGAELLHLGGRAVAYAPERALIAFHRSAYRYVRKHGSVLERTFTPVVYVGLGARLVLKLAWHRVRRAISSSRT